MGTNLSIIGSLLNVDITAALDFYNKVCSEVSPRPSTYEVVYALQYCRKHQGKGNIYAQLVSRQLIADRIESAKASRISQKQSSRKTSSQSSSKKHRSHKKTASSESFSKTTSDPLTSDEANQLAVRRDALVAEQKRRQDELRRAEAARRQEIADQRAAQRKVKEKELHQRVAEMATRRRVEEEEFRQLIAEMQAYEFTRSSQVSRYIVQNRLGHKYKHISGILQMEQDGEVWDFDGGFPPKIYARLCEALGLGNQGSRAVPGKFTPYKDILEQ